MIESLFYSLVLGLVYSFGFLYFADQVFIMKCSLKKACLLCLLIFLPYNIIGSVSYYLSNFTQSPDSTLLILGVIGFCLLLGGRQLLLMTVFDTTFKSSVTYQFVVYFITLTRYSVEDFLLYFVQIISNQYLMLLLTLLIKSCLIICCYVIANHFSQSIKNTFFKTSDYVCLFVMFYMCMFLDNTKGLVYNAFVSFISILSLYLVLRHLIHSQEIRQMKELEEKQFQMVQEEYHLQKKKHDEISKIRHDQKNHMLTFLALYKQNKKEGIEYLENWHKNLKEQDDLLN